MIDSYNYTENKFLKIEEIVFRIKIPTQIKLPKKILAKFSYPKKSRNRKFQTQKNPWIIPVTWNPEYPPGIKVNRGKECPQNEKCSGRNLTNTGARRFFIELSRKARLSWRKNPLKLATQIITWLTVNFTSKPPNIHITIMRRRFFGPMRIQDSLGFWIPRCGFRITGTGLQSLSVELGFLIPIENALVGFRIP